MYDTAEIPGQQSDTLGQLLFLQHLKEVSEILALATVSSSGLPPSSFDHTVSPNCNLLHACHTACSTIIGW